MQTRILEQYSMRANPRLGEPLRRASPKASSRTGPYLDVVEGRQAYVDYLSGVIPTLRNYELEVFRIRELDGGSALVELSESVDVDEVRTEFPEAILFDFDAEGYIARIDIYIKQPPTHHSEDADRSS